MEGDACEERPRGYEDPAIIAKQDRHDDFIVRIFPGFVVFFAVLSIVLLLVFWDTISLAHFLYALCCSYTLGFTVLGIPVMFMSTNTVIRKRVVFPVIVVAATVVGLLLWFIFGDSPTGPNEFISGLFYVIVYSVDEVNVWSVLLGIYVLAFITIASSYGVISVVTAYFRKNYHRIMLSLMKPGDSKLKRYARKAFNIPSIIDVTDVTIDIEPDGVFDTKLFYSIFGYVVVVGLVIASYLFLNPVFLQSIPFTEMMVIIILISLFICVMVIPCSILRSLNAEAHSVAPRPFMLWVGMKSRLFHGGFYVVIVLTLLWISLSTGMDFSRICTSYIGYFLFLFCMSAIVSFVYVNTFYTGFKNGIARNFDAEKARRAEEKEKGNDD